MGQRILNAAATLVIAIAVLFSATDLAEYLHSPGAYPIGCEEAPLRYATPARFVGTNLATVLLGLAAAFAGLRYGATRRTLAAKILVAGLTASLLYDW